MTNRRQFLSGCSALALAAAFSPTALPAACVFTAPERLSFAAFSKSVGSIFSIRREAESSIHLELIRARRQPASRFESANAADAAHEKFSLMFRGPQIAALGQNTYAFEHDEIGRFEMFIVPVGVRDERYGYYEAVFNRSAGGPLAV
jgi:hypothetical protein